MVEMALSGGWSDAEWLECDADGTSRPLRFDTEAEANAAIDEHIADATEAGLEYSREDYRAVPVSE